MPTELNANVVGLSPVNRPAREGADAVTTVLRRQDAPVGGAAVKPPGEQEAPVPQTTLTEMVSNLNDHVQTVRRNLQFSVDEQSGRQVIKVMDSETKEVIRQIPPEDILGLIHRLDDLEGLILKVKA